MPAETRSQQTILPELQDGIEYFYAADWSDASRIFQSRIETHPEETLAYFMEAMIPFWLYFFGGEDSRIAVDFQNKSQLAIQVAETHLKSQPADTSVILMLSGLYGYQSLVAVKESQYRHAMRAGMSGYTYTKKILEMDTDNPNALIGQGLFLYMVGSAPGAVRWMASAAGVKGNKAEGIKLLKKASKSDSYVSKDAAMILTYLFFKEGWYDEAVEVISPIAAQYSKNIIFQYYHAKALENNGDKQAALQAYRNVITHRRSELQGLVDESRNRLEVLTAEK